MKSKVIYIILLFAACLTLQSQTQAQETQAQTTEFPTATQTQTQKPPEIIPEHEISFLYGESFTLGLLSPLAKPDKSAGRFSFSYLYRIKGKWLGVGATSTIIPYSINYLQRNYNITETANTSNSEVITSQGSIFSFAAEIRLYALSRPWVNLYGGAALGYMADYSTNNITKNITSELKHFAYYQITIIGVSAGKNFIWGTELGFGRKGIINMYIGYKF